MNKAVLAIKKIIIIFTVVITVSVIAAVLIMRDSVYGALLMTQPLQDVIHFIC